MKHSPLLLVIALTSIPGFAADDLCSSKLQELNAVVANSGKKPVGSEPEKFFDFKEKAEKAQAAGDSEKCVELADQAMQIYQKVRHK